MTAPAWSRSMTLEVEPGEDLADRAGGRHLAVGEDDDRIGEAGDLVDRVADIDDRQPHLVAQPLDIGKDLGLARLVERGERLVHEEEARARQQRAADRDPLLLAAGEAGRPPGEEARRCRAGRRSPSSEPQRSFARRAAGGRRGGCRGPSDAGTAGPPGRRSRSGGDAAGTSMPRAVSKSTAPSTAMRPRSGRARPAMRLTSVVLPEPERPKRAVTPAGAGEVGGERESAERLLDVDRERHRPSIRAVDAPRQGVGGDQRGEGDGDRRSRSGAARRRRRRAPGCRCRSRSGWSG